MRTYHVVTEKFGVIVHESKTEALETMKEMDSEGNPVLYMQEVLMTDSEYEKLKEFESN